MASCSSMALARRGGAGCSTSYGHLPSARSLGPRNSRVCARGATRGSGRAREELIQDAQYVDLHEVPFYADPRHPPAPERGQEELLFHTIIEKQYRQKLRDFRRVLTAEAVQELRDSTPPEQAAQLEAILRDVAALGDEVATSSWEEDALTPEEQQHLLTLQQQDVSLPDDLASYLAGLLPEGADPRQVAALLQSLDGSVLSEMESLYEEMKAFLAFGLELDDGGDKYLELSARMAELTERMQAQALAGLAASLPPDGQASRTPGHRRQGATEVAESSSLTNAVAASSVVISGSDGSGGGSVPTAGGSEAAVKPRRRRRGSIFAHSSS